ncbi:hypothetical protein B0O99DRAFT_598546 [Bisporella sp. PMI_857]|nr:hypothetical protein B0O99DRAFT_598546 [Bisporella sp. PMI_857]
MASREETQIRPTVGSLRLKTPPTGTKGPYLSPRIIDPQALQNNSQEDSPVPASQVYSPSPSQSFSPFVPTRLQRTLAKATYSQRQFLTKQVYYNISQHKAAAKQTFSDLRPHSQAANKAAVQDPAPPKGKAVVRGATSDQEHLFLPEQVRVSELPIHKPPLLSIPWPSSQPTAPRDEFQPDDLSQRTSIRRNSYRHNPDLALLSQRLRVL